MSDPAMPMHDAGSAKSSRNNASTAPRRVRSSLNKMVALKMRAAGKSWTEIATALGMSNPKSAYNLTKRALSELPEVFGVEEERALMCMRLDGIVEALWPNRADPPTAQALTRAISQRTLLLGLKTPV